MSDNGEMRYSFIERLDTIVFVKNCYSVCKHLVPFAIASLLLLMFSISKENLLLKLVDLLQKPGLPWLPAGVVALVSTVVYVLTIYVQIRKAYLWKYCDLRRTIGTSLTYIFLCMLMAYAVLWSISSEEKNNLVYLGASYLLAILSLTGIGWSGPNSWVESIGIQSPDYMDGRQAAKRLADILKQVRENGSNRRDVEDFKKNVESLLSNIEKNLEIEPKWRAKDELINAIDALRILQNEVEMKFLTKNGFAVQLFADACRYNDPAGQYDEFMEKLKALSSYWCEWKWKEPDRGG